MNKLIEEELRDNKIYVIAGLLAYAFAAAYDDYEGEAKDYLNKEWKQAIEGLQESNWANGRHEGDCTKVSATCHRCYIEDLVNEAKEILEQVSNEPTT